MLTHPLITIKIIGSGGKRRFLLLDPIIFTFGMGLWGYSQLGTPPQKNLNLGFKRATFLFPGFWESFWNSLSGAPLYFFHFKLPVNLLKMCPNFS